MIVKHNYLTKLNMIDTNACGYVTCDPKNHCWVHTTPSSRSLADLHRCLSFFQGDLQICIEVSVTLKLHHHVSYDCSYLK